MDSSTSIISSISDGVLTLTLNRPHCHNAFDEVLINELLTKLQAAEQDLQVRVVVLAGSGKNFCAGADLNWMRKMAQYSYAENLADARKLADLMQTLAALSKPTIACVQGLAYGGAIGLIACCDIAIATEQTRFAFTETRLGLVPAVISPYIIQAMGERAARRYFLTGEVFDGQAAQQAGLIHILTQEQLLITTVHEQAQQMLQNSPQALAATKKLLNAFNKVIINEELIEQTISCIANIRVSAEGQEGLSAFLEKERLSGCCENILEFYIIT